MYLGSFSFYTVVPISNNLLANPSFEQMSLPFHPHYWTPEYRRKVFSKYWEPFLVGYNVDHTIYRSGANSIQMKPKYLVIFVFVKLII